VQLITGYLQTTSLYEGRTCSRGAIDQDIGSNLRFEFVCSHIFRYVGESVLQFGQSLHFG